MRAKIITVINQKGGVAKTLTVHNFGYGLAARGYKVLLVDMDYQCNLSYVLKINNAQCADIWDVLAGYESIKAATLSDTRLSVVKGSEYLAKAESMFEGDGERLLNALEAVREDYDYIIVDTPPGLGICSINALVASDGVIVPVTAEMPAIMGAYALDRTITELRNMGYEITIDGILVVRYNPRLRFTAVIEPLLTELASDMGTHLFNTRIRNSVAGAVESQGYQQSVYSRKGNLAADYDAFVSEYLEVNHGN